LAVIMGLGAAAAPAGAQDLGFDRMVVFGDSLSDIGNAGRFSNGPVWVEHLAGALGLTLAASAAGGADHAVGGARLDPRSGPDSLRAQVDRALASPPIAGRTLYVVYGGGNDVLGAVSAGGDAGAVEIAAGTLGGIVRDLVAAGATDILVPNLPDVGMTPAVRSYGAPAPEVARRLSQAFNAAADRALAGIPSGIARIHRLDVWQMAEQVRADPGASGFNDVTTPCSNAPGCEGFLFFDGVHPTTAAHARLAEAALALLRSG
jgi:phospholipase/lecithinase/hemolysin